MATPPSDKVNIVTIGGILECSVCLEKFKKPKNLACGHTFCLECLIGYANDEDEDEMLCPLCRHAFQVPPGGMQQLPNNFLIDKMLEAFSHKELELHENEEDSKCETCSKDVVSKFCVECSQDLCEACALIHSKTRFAQSHKIVTQEDKKSSPLAMKACLNFCERHNGKELEWYCNDCEIPICLKCSVLDHKSHLTSDIQQVSDEVMGDILKDAAGFDQLVKINTMELQQLESEKDGFLKELLSAEFAIKTKGESVKRLVDSQVNALMEQLESLKSDKLKQIETRKCEIERQLLLLKSHQQYVDMLTNYGTPCDVIRNVNDILKRAGEILTSQKEIEDDKPYSLKVKFHESFVHSKSSRSAQLIGTLETEENIEKTLVVVGHDTTSSVEPQVYHVSLQDVDTVEAVIAIPTVVRNEATACTFADSLYAVGLGESRNELWKYTEKSEWTRLADMESGRSRHCVAVVGSMLYVLGGWDNDGTALSSVLGYNISSNSWSTVGQLTRAAYSAACVVYNGSAYVFGGSTSDEDDDDVDYVQMYNTGSQKCTLMPNAMPEAYRLMRAVLWKTSALLLGYYTCFIYNFETQTWLEREQYKTDVAHFGIALNKATLYIAGGGLSELNDDGKCTRWRCSDEVKSVSVLDIIWDKPAAWKHHAKLPKTTLVSVFSPAPPSLVST